MPGHLRRRSLVLTLTLVLVAGAAPPAASAAPPTMSTATIADGLAYPWDIAFLPDGAMLVTERAGRVRVYSSGAVGATLVRTVTIPSVRAEGESGLMGIAVDVDFALNRFVYVCASREYSSSGGWKNQVIRYTIAANGSWGSAVVLIPSMIANVIHNGCALEMDPSGKLWVGMGDAANPALAQNRNSLNGKILRLNRSGSVPSDNPLIAGTRNMVYTMGHRNPQGLAIRPGTNQVYAVEHGPDVNDEVNLLVAGGNYGWPCYTGAGSPYQTSGCSPASSYRNPLWSSGGSTIATSGAAFAGGSQWADYNGQLFVSTLKERDVRRFSIDGVGTSLGNPVTHFNESWGRLRAMVSGPGGQLYVTTSNGTNDRVIRISSAQPSTVRRAGADRYASAAALSAAAFPAGAPRVFVATGADFPDALAGGAAAGLLSNPVLLVQQDRIPPATATELDRLNPSEIVVLGGPSVISESVRTDLAVYSSNPVTPVSGTDRYGTAAAVSARYYAPGVKAVFIATGTGFADALAGAPAAALLDSPLLLVKPWLIPPATKSELERLNPQRIYVLGGGASVNSSVATRMHEFTDGPVTRISGTDRYATGAAITRAFWTKSAEAFVATGLGFADALAGTAIAGKDGVPMLLVAGTSVPLTTGQEVLRLSSHRLTVVGGISVVSPAAETRLKRLMGTP
ncbi:MAG: PQQ-dependent sugar dehydrogenase [Candidatus Limnocylindria bacterium]